MASSSPNSTEPKVLTEPEITVEPSHVIRRHSIARFLHLHISNKHPKPVVQTIEEHSGDTEEGPVWERLNKKLYVSFADRHAREIHQSHVNSIFESEEAEKHKYFSFSFGKKGRKKGEYDDVKSITLIPGGRLLTTDLTNSRLHLSDKHGGLLMIYAGSDLREPWATALLGNNNIAVTSEGNKCVEIITLEGEKVKTFGTGFFEKPAGIAVDSAGNLIVSDTKLNTVSIHDGNGKFIRYLGDPDFPEQTFSKPRYVCVSLTGEIIVSDSENHKIKIFDCNGDFKKSFGSYGSRQNQMKYPYGVCSSEYGDIFIADHYNNRITVFTQDGVFKRHLITSTHGLCNPQGIAMSADMKLYVSHGKLKANEILVFNLYSSSGRSSLESSNHM